jgi:segregation and condensation protein A
MEYVDLMKELRLELAAEYLVMAASLAEIKSRMLLPRPGGAEDDEDDPRAELVRRLQEYERFKKAALDLDSLPRLERDFQTVSADAPNHNVIQIQPTVSLQDMLFALKDVMTRAQMYAHHHIEMEPLSVRERMSNVLATVEADHFVEFTSLFTPEEGKSGVVVTLLAILELLKASLIEMVQTESFGTIHVKAAASIHSSDDDSNVVELKTDLD